MTVTPFQSFFMGGFECSTHRLGNGRRLDMLAASGHDTWLAHDYARLQAVGLRTARSGIRWHCIEPRPGVYDFSTALPHLQAARHSGTQVIWDLCHYGYPDDLDIFTPAFVRRFAAMVRTFARFYRDHTDQPAFFSPVNEISFFSWGAGDVGYLNPFARGRGFELKVQLVRAAIEATEAAWDVLPDARIVHTDPIINIITHPDRPHEHGDAQGHHHAQFQAWDMLTGHMWPQLGGAPRYLDIIGLNYYPNNQWLHGGPPVFRHEPLYRPLRELLHDVYARYARPMFIAETGTEDEDRAGWLAYVADEVAAALHAGTPVTGICWYPILNHPGWDNDRHCHNGLWDYPDDDGNRTIHAPLAAVLRQKQPQLTHISHSSSIAALG